MPNYARTHIADAVTAANTKVLGDSPATAMGNLMIAASQFIATNMQNQANEQGQEEVIWQTATTEGVNTLINIEAAIADMGRVTVQEPGVIPATAMNNIPAMPQAWNVIAFQNLTQNQQQQSEENLAAMAQGINALMNTGNAVKGELVNQILTLPTEPHK